MDIFEVLAEPARRAVLDALAAGPQPAGVLVEALAPLSQPAVSRHLRVMREAGVLTVRPDGQRRVYSIDPQALYAVDRWLQRYHHLWSNALDRLDTHLRQGKADPL